MLIHFDNQDAIVIENNPSLHECIMIIDITCHNACDKVLARLINALILGTYRQLHDIITKGLA